MRFTPPGRHRDVASFREHIQQLDPEFDCDLELLGTDGALGAPIELEGRTLDNRFAIHPMEGWDGTPEGLPSEHTLRRWQRFGRSGAPLIWGGEAFAVQADGRANPRQLYWNKGAEVLAALSRLRANVRDGRITVGLDPDRSWIGLQLTHSGRFSRPQFGAAQPRIAFHHPVLDRKFGIEADQAALSDSELEGIAENYVGAARLAAEAGFDFVDLKCCHGYLMHELLSARTRPGPYGGAFENRTRLLLQILDEIRRSCPALHIGVRVSIADLFPHSAAEDDATGAPRDLESHLPYEHGFGVDAADPRRFDLTEPFRFLRLLAENGVRIVNLTLGSPYYCPHLQRPASYPPSDGYQPPRDPLLDVFEHLKVTRACKRSFPELMFVGTGYSYLQEYLPHVAQYELAAGHVDFVGLGRMVLSYPELPRDVLAGKTLARKLLCRTFSDCTTAPRKDMISGCYPLDDHYRALPEAQRLKQIKLAERKA